MFSCRKIRRAPYRLPTLQVGYPSIKTPPELMMSSAKKIGNGQDVSLSADLVNVSQYITCYVMCDDFGKQHTS